jgi:hypothetical protein
MTEATGSSIVTLGNSDTCDVSNLRKEISDRIFGSVETDVTAEDTCTVCVIPRWLTVSVGFFSSGKFDRDFSSGVRASIFGTDGFSCAIGIVVFDEGDSTGSSIFHNQLTFSHGSMATENFA